MVRNITLCQHLITQGVSLQLEEILIVFSLCAARKLQPLILRHQGKSDEEAHQGAGGIYAYPATPQEPHGKLRNLFEVFPGSFLITQAGGMATDGINTITPGRTELHARSPILIGSKREVELARSYMQGD